MARLVLVLVLVLVAVYVLGTGPQAALIAAKRWLPLVAAFAYLVLPADLVPDVGPAGMIDDLVALAAAWWFGRRWARQGATADAEAETGPRVEPDAAADPWQVLGVERGASRDEIIRAYRDQLKRYHPDRVAGLGEELQRVAHDKTVALRRAYEQLVGQSR